MTDSTHLRGVGGIYRIIHPESGKCYIGRSGDIAKRWAAHLSDLANGTDHHSAYLQHAWNKYGADAFHFEVIVLESDPERRITLEQYYLDKRLFEKGSKEYNMSASSRGPVGVKHSPEVRRRMGESHKGTKRSPESIRKSMETRNSHPPTWKELAWRAQLGDVNRARLQGIPKPQEEREKIRQALAGKPPSPAAQAANTARRGRPLNERQVAANTLRRGRPLNENQLAYHARNRGRALPHMSEWGKINQPLAAKASAEKRRGKPAAPNVKRALDGIAAAKRARHRGLILDAMQQLGWGTVLPASLAHFGASRQIAAVHDLNPRSVFRSLSEMIVVGIVTRQQVEEA